MLDAEANRTENPPAVRAYSISKDTMVTVTQEMYDELAEIATINGMALRINRAVTELAERLRLEKRGHKELHDLYKQLIG